MPLDDLARRYADNLYIQELDQITNEIKEKTITLRKGHFQRRVDPHQVHLITLAEIEPQRTEALARARYRSLVAAYEAAGLQIGNFEFEGIVAELKQLCDIRKSSIANELQGLAVRTGRQHDSQLEALNAQINREMDCALVRVLREIRIKLDGVTLASRRSQSRQNEEQVEWDVFISYAGPDKDSFARPLKEALEGEGLRVWFAEVELKVGDSLRSAIDRGLRKSMFGVVILSPSFFARKWSKIELDGLLALETPARKVILPVWYQLTEDMVKTYSPILAGRLAARGEEGLDVVVRKLLEVIRPTESKA